MLITNNFGKDHKTHMNSKMLVGGTLSPLEALIDSIDPSLNVVQYGNSNWYFKEEVFYALELENIRPLADSHSLIKMHDYEGNGYQYSLAWHGSAPKLHKSKRIRQKHVKLEQWKYFEFNNSGVHDDNAVANPRSIRHFLYDLAFHIDARITGCKEEIIHTSMRQLASLLAGYLFAYDYSAWKRDIHELPGSYIVFNYPGTAGFSLLTSRDVTKKNPGFSFSKQVLNDIFYYAILQRKSTKRLMGWGKSDCIFTGHYGPYEKVNAAGYGTITINRGKYECFTTSEKEKTCGYYVSYLLSVWNRFSGAEIIGWSEVDYAELKYPKDGLSVEEMRKDCDKAKIPLYIIKTEEDLDAATAFYATHRPAVWYVVSGNLMHFCLAVHNSYFLQKRELPNLKTPGALITALGCNMLFNEEESLLTVLNCHIDRTRQNKYTKKQIEFYKSTGLMTPEEVSKTLKLYDYSAEYDIPEYDYKWTPKHRLANFRLSFVDGYYNLVPITDYGRCKVLTGSKLKVLPDTAQDFDALVINDFVSYVPKSNVVLKNKEEEKREINRMTGFHGEEEEKDPNVARGPQTLAKAIPRVSFDTIATDRPTSILKVKSDVSDRSVVTDKSKKSDDSEYEADEKTEKTYVAKIKRRMSPYDDDPDFPDDPEPLDLIKFLNAFRPTHVKGPDGNSALNKSKNIWMLIGDGLAKLSAGNRTYSFGLTMAIHPGDEIQYIHPVTFIRRELHSPGNGLTDLDKLIDTFILPKLAANSLTQKDVSLCVEYVRLRSRVSLSQADYDAIVLMVAERVKICKASAAFLTKFYNDEFETLPEWTLFPSLYTDNVAMSYMPVKLLGILPINARLDKYGKYQEIVSSINRWSFATIGAALIGYGIYRVRQYKHELKAKLHASIKAAEQARIASEKATKLAATNAAKHSQIGIFKRIWRYFFGAPEPKPWYDVALDTFKEYFVQKHFTLNGRETQFTTIARNVGDSMRAYKGYGFFESDNGTSPYSPQPLRPTFSNLTYHRYTNNYMPYDERGAEMARRIKLWFNFERFRGGTKFLEWRYGYTGIQFIEPWYERVFRTMFYPTTGFLSWAFGDDRFFDTYVKKYRANYAPGNADDDDLGFGHDELPTQHDENVMKMLAPTVYKKTPTTFEEYAESKRIARALQYCDNLTKEPVDRVVMTGVKYTHNDNLEILAEKPLAHYVDNAFQDINWQKKDNKYVQTKHATHDVYMNANAKIAEMNDYNFLHALINRQAGTLLHPDPRVVKDF